MIRDRIQKRTGRRTPWRVLALSVLVGGLVASALPASSDVTVTPAAGREGEAGYEGDGLDPTIAKMNTPSGVVNLGADGIFIADSQNNRIRRIVPGPTGVGIGITNPGAGLTTGVSTITTVAGTGQAGFSGDGGHPLNATLNHPLGIAGCTSSLRIDLYVADTLNHRIRRVSIPKVPAGATITTVPSVIIDPGAAVISTVAGTGVAGFSGDAMVPTNSRLNFPSSTTCSDAFPAGIGDQVVKVADTENHRIRQLTVGQAAEPKNIVTIAGNGKPGYSGDSGTATEAQLNRPLFVANCNNGDFTQGGGTVIGDTGNNRVRHTLRPQTYTAIGIGQPGVTFDNPLPVPIRTIAGTGAVTTSAPNFGDGGDAKDAVLDRPWGISCTYSDSAGFTFVIVDSGHGRLRRVRDTDGSGMAYYTGAGGGFVNPEKFTIESLSGQGALKWFGARGITTVADDDPSPLANVPATYVTDGENHVLRRVVIT